MTGNIVFYRNYFISREKSFNKKSQLKAIIDQWCLDIKPMLGKGDVFFYVISTNSFDAIQKA